MKEVKIMSKQAIDAERIAWMGNGFHGEQVSQREENFSSLSNRFSKDRLKGLGGEEKQNG